jgi:hypothetical protein
MGIGCCDASPVAFVASPFIGDGRKIAPDFSELIWNFLGRSELLRLLGLF